MFTHNNQGQLHLHYTVHQWQRQKCASCTPAPPSPWWLWTAINSELQMHITINTCTQICTQFTQTKLVHWILHCRCFNTVFHTLTDPITGQRSQDRPILPQYTTGPPPTHVSPSSQRFPHSFILLSSHPFAQLSSLTSSPLNGYWLCSQSLRSLSVPVTNVSANQRFAALSDPISIKQKQHCCCFLLLFFF